MKRLAAILLILCLLLSGCSPESDGLLVETERAATIPTTMDAETTSITDATTAPITEPTTEPTTLPPTEPTTVPTTEAITEPTTEATTEPTEPPTEATEEEIPASDAQDYVLNKNSKKFHYPSCGSVKQMKQKNRWDFFGTREEVLAKGYVPCKNCKP